MDPIERLRFLAPGTGAREGGEKMQPFNRFPSHRISASHHKDTVASGQIFCPNEAANRRCTLLQTNHHVCTFTGNKGDKSDNGGKIHTAIM